MLNIPSMKRAGKILKDSVRMGSASKVAKTDQKFWAQ